MVEKWVQSELWLVYDAVLSILGWKARRESVLACRRAALSKNRRPAARTPPPPHTTMESPHPDERPLKKRRFFSDDQPPVQVPPVPNNADQAEDGTSLDGFDVGTLQAIVGELPLPTLQQLKKVSGSDVQRGRHMPI